MSEWSESKLHAMEELSALTDGELDEPAAARSCAHWSRDAESRDAWHAYQLIGDVLRSDDLASTRKRDTDFLVALRGRLAQEPVVLAPAAMAAPRADVEKSRSRRSWAAPAAVAAGFVAVAGVLVASQMSGALSSREAAADARMAQGASAPSALVSVQANEVMAVPAVNQSNDPQSVVLNGRLIRDVRLDEYLAAHKRFGGSTAPGVPSGFLRNAAVDGSR